MRGISLKGVHLASALTIVLLGIASGRPAWAQTTPEAEETPPLIDVDGTTALVFVGLVVLGVALLWFVPLYRDATRANTWRAGRQAEIIEKLIDKAGARRGLSIEEVRQLVSAMDQPPRGASGLTQSLLALIIATLVGVGLVATLVSTSIDSADLRKTIVTSLLSVLATIAGFYFGARTAQTSTEQATRPPRPTDDRGRPPPGAPEVDQGETKTDGEQRVPGGGQKTDLDT